MSLSLSLTGPPLLHETLLRKLLYNKVWVYFYGKLRGRAVAWRRKKSIKIIIKYNMKIENRTRERSVVSTLCVPCLNCVKSQKKSVNWSRLIFIDNYKFHKKGEENSKVYMVKRPFVPDLPITSSSSLCSLKRYFQAVESRNQIWSQVLISHVRINPVCRFVFLWKPRW